MTAGFIDQNLVNTRTGLAAQGLYRIDRASSSVTYEGWAAYGTLTSAPKWQIRRTSIQGTQTVYEYAGGGKFNQAWDDRASLFESIPFSNAYSTLLDGVNDYVDLGNNFNDERTQAWTKSFWVRHRVVSTLQYIYSKQANNASPGMSFWMQGNARYSFTLYNSSTNRITLNSPVGSVLGDTWLNAVLTYDGSSTAAGVKLYINGNSIPFTVANDTLTSSILTSQSAYLGQIGGVSFFDGHMDEVTFWDAALTHAEVIELYNSGDTYEPTTHSKAANLTNWWRMGDQDVYPIISDRKGSINGTLTNATSGAFVEDVA